ncbi:peptidylprolyl isomerase [Synechococcus sp. RSCCF101]|uniref:peptidylprolyl isomerase n=1 Tax=Synechococcus sp. RSCCF101 TaxID=2511069 RepID=UPI0012451F09|nr:peptidylprolyl isomerase [Synechococcus sp. RSCCF101]QEY32337.1 peptidylprolyl isomerase [Synechococcus sp. RSCCF101]
MNNAPSFPDLQTVLGSDGLRLVRQQGLLRQLVQQLVIAGAIEGIQLTDDEETQARQGLLQGRGLTTPEQWRQHLERSGLSEEEATTLLLRPVLVARAAQERFGAKAEARFLARKNQLDRVVYSLLRLKDPFLAQELYLQIESGEANFADLAAHHSQGSERNTNGIVGPVALTQAHPTLAEKLRTCEQGTLLEPFPVADWWLVVRLERYAPASFTPAIAQQMGQELFEEWVNEETTRTLSALVAATPPSPSE